MPMERLWSPRLAKKLFSLRGEAGSSVPGSPPLQSWRSGTSSGRILGGLGPPAIRPTSRKRSNKLDRWAEDLKQALERELKDLDAEIRAARKASKAGVTLADNLKPKRSSRIWS